MFDGVVEDVVGREGVGDVSGRNERGKEWSRKVEGRRVERSEHHTLVGDTLSIQVESEGTERDFCGSNVYLRTEEWYMQTTTTYSEELVVEVRSGKYMSFGTRTVGTSVA